MHGSAINKLGRLEKNKRVKEGPCIFPFTYKWQEHTKCFPTPKGDICATSLSTSSKKRTLKTYGYCIKKQKKKITLKRPKKVRIRTATPRKKIEVKKRKRTKSKQTKKVKMSKSIRVRKPKKIKVVKLKPLNKSLIDLLARLKEQMQLEGEPFRARAYHKAMETVMMHTAPITDVNVLKGKPAIGKTILAII